MAHTPLHCDDERPWRSADGSTLHAVWRVSWQGPASLSPALLRAAADAGMLLCSPQPERVQAFAAKHWCALREFITVQLRCAWSEPSESTDPPPGEAGASGGGGKGGADEPVGHQEAASDAADAPQRRRAAAAGSDDAAAGSVSPAAAHRRSAPSHGPTAVSKTPGSALTAPAQGGTAEPQARGPVCSDDTQRNGAAEPVALRSTWTGAVHAPPFQLLWHREAMLLIAVAPPSRRGGSPGAGAPTCTVHVVASSGVPGSLLGSVMACVRPPRDRHDAEEGEGAARKALEG